METPREQRVCEKGGAQKSIESAKVFWKSGS